MKKITLSIFTFVLLLSLIQLMSCASGKESAQDTKTKLVNTYWKLTEIDGSKVTVIQGMNEPYIILAAEQTLSGNTGCNSLYGKYSTSNDKLTFSDISTTKMACTEPEISGVEIKFLEALKTASGYKLTGGNLELYSNDKLLARFTPKTQ